MVEAAGSDAVNRFSEAMFRLLVGHHQRLATELGLTFVQISALRLVRLERMSTGQLAQELRISAPAVTQLTDRLIKKKLIQRIAAPQDRRSVLIGASAKGKKVVDRYREGRGALFSAALSPMKGAERSEVLAALEKLAIALEQYESQTPPGSQ